MNLTIWKFVLAITDRQQVPIPFGGECLTVQFQGEALCLWALVNPSNSAEERLIEIFGTGHPIYEDMGVQRNYIGTAQQHGGALVWHVFERA